MKGFLDCTKNEIDGILLVSLATTLFPFFILRNFFTVYMTNYSLKKIGFSPNPYGSAVSPRTKKRFWVSIMVSDKNEGFASTVETVLLVLSERVSYNTISWFRTLKSETSNGFV